MNETKKDLNKKAKFSDQLICKLYPTAFSGELAFEVYTKCGLKYGGIVSRHYASVDKALLSKDGIIGTIKVYIIRSNNMEATIRLPDYEVITVPINVIKNFTPQEIKFNTEKHNPIMRTFSTGAKRDTNEGKVNYIRAISQPVLKCYGKYMLKHNSQRNGEKRKEDNWKKGFTPQSYMESKFRHFIEGTWELFAANIDDNDKLTDDDQILAAMLDALNAELFNTMGMMHTILLKQHKDKIIDKPVCIAPKCHMATKYTMAAKNQGQEQY